MNIKEHRAKIFMELMNTKPHTPSRTTKLAELRVIDATILSLATYHDDLREAQFGYIIR